jgi:methionine sulfoxide reductase heme-binding subunit
MNDVNFNKLLISANALLPLAFLAFDGSRGNLGANPLEFFLRTTGVLTLSFVVLTLSVSPLRKMFGWNGLIKYRRMLGLFAFFYGCVHLTTYSVFDKGLDVPAIIADVIQRPFIAIGMTALLFMVPLAVTSTNGMVKRLGGKRWSRLHKLTYVVAVLGVIHFWMIVKSDVFYPAIFALVVAVLLGYRLFDKFRPKAAVPKKPMPAKS